ARHLFRTREREQEIVGVELELLAYEHTVTGIEIPPIRATVDRLLPVVTAIATDRRCALKPPDGGPLVGDLEGGKISFEPGGQVEFSSPPCTSPANAFSCVSEAARQLDEGMSSAGLALPSFAYDPLTPFDAVPLQLRDARYDCFFEMFDSVGVWGRGQAVNTTSIQVALDHGPTEEGKRRRWLTAQRLSPVATAIFAASPFASGLDSGFRS